jgi:hypothetical protein
MRTIPIISGEKYTLYAVSTATTAVRTEITILVVLDTPEFHSCHNGAKCVKHRIGTYTADHSHSPAHLDIDLHGTLIIPGWDTPAIVGMMDSPPSPEELHEILAVNVNPHFERYELLAPCPDTLDSLTVTISE